MPKRNISTLRILTFTIVASGYPIEVIICSHKRHFRIDNVFVIIAPKRQELPISSSDVSAGLYQNRRMRPMKQQHSPSCETHAQHGAFALQVACDQF